MISLRDVVTGFGNRDPLAEVWRRSLRGGGGGAAEITGVPPLRYIGDGKPLTDYRIAGNAVQDGTPSHDAPVDAAGSGVRTGNLFDADSVIRRDGYLLNDNGVEQTTLFSGYTLSKTPVKSGETYTISGKIAVGTSTFRVYFYSGNSFVSRSSQQADVPYTFTIPNGCDAIAIQYITEAVDFSTIMLNLGSTALPYEPYGFKLPPTVNGTEYPIYLGQVETTRRVKKLVLTGEEIGVNKCASPESSYSVSIDRNNWSASITGYGLSSHFVQNRTVANMNDGEFYVGSTAFSFRINACANVNEFRQYLRDEYAAGTPVTVWYVLAEPETAIVNEPLMKIGDYADTVSFAQAGVTIPTENGENILDVPTEVPPSQITIKGGIKDV